MLTARPAALRVSGIALALGLAAGGSSGCQAAAEQAEAVSAGSDAGAAVQNQLAVVAPGTEILVYRTPWCGCCAKWGEHLEASGFEVRTEQTREIAAVKMERGVPRALQSCHTAVVDGYVIEGHVPAEVIARLLRERPDIAGLAVPGMPAGSPGMEMAGQPSESYEVIAWSETGETRVFERREAGVAGR